MDARDGLPRSRFPASRTLWTSSGSQSSRCKRGFRAYLCYLDEENNTFTNFPGNIGFNVESKGSHNKNGF